MSDFSQKELDAIFRDGADKHEFAYNDAAWKKMESKLDRQDKRRKALWFVISGLIVLLSIIIGLSVSSDQPEKDIVTISAQESNKISDVTSIKTDQKVETEDAIANAEVVDNISSTVQIKEKSIVTENTVLTNESSSDAPISIEVKNSEIFITNNDENQSSEFITEVISDSESESQILNLADIADKNEINKRSDLKHLQNLVLLKTSFAYLQSSRPAISLDDQTLYSSEPLSKIDGGNRFALKFMGSSEWSTLDLMDKPRAGWRFGSAIGYQFADRFEMSLGVAYSRKIFSGPGTEYNARQGFWIDDIVPMTMDAKCDIIEVPLSLAFYPSGFRNNGFFAEFGFSTFRLHSEWYGFTYEPSQMQPGLREEHVQENANSHMLGAGRLELGYQKIINNHTTLQAAPYVQLPLGGIGDGKVMLFSAGLQLAVKFNSN